MTAIVSFAVCMELNYGLFQLPAMTYMPRDFDSCYIHTYLAAVLCANWEIPSFYLLFSWQGLGIFLFTTVSRMALGPTQPPIQRVPGVLSLGVKWPGAEAEHSPPSIAEVKRSKNEWNYTSTPLICLHGMVLS
jgi:hypothetical protein